MEKPNDVYVTYKWLFATAISLLIITLSFVYFVYGSMSQALGAKADIMWVEQKTNINKTRIDALSTQLDKMEFKQDEMLKELYNIKSLVKNNRKDK